MWKRRFILAGWFALGAVTLILLGAAMQAKERKVCTAFNVQIISKHRSNFIGEDDITGVLKSDGGIVGKEISAFDLRKMETDLEKNKWIRHAALFFDNQQILRVRIEERDPLARVFTVGGNSFYIDSSGLRLPCSDQQTAFVPVFTSFGSDNKILSKEDSLGLEDIKRIARYIREDSFWTAMIAQVNIGSGRTYEMIPVVGDQVIEFGTADSIRNKFNRLFSFYKQVWVRAGFEKYAKIDLRFDGQVVATLRGSNGPAMDTAKAMQVLDHSTTNLKLVLQDTNFAAPVKPAATTLTEGVEKSKKSGSTYLVKQAKHLFLKDNQLKPKAVMPPK